MPDPRLLLNPRRTHHGAVTSATHPRPDSATGPASAIMLAPGLALCAVAVLIAMTVSHLVPVMSALLIAIVLGAALANTVALPSSVRPGVGFAAKRLL